MRKNVLLKKNSLRQKRKEKIRDSIFGIADKPRVSVFKSNRYFYAQAIDDKVGISLASVDGKHLKLGNNREDVKKIAEVLADKLKSQQIENVVFDRNGYLYHGVVASFADALRENGIKF